MDVPISGAAEVLKPVDFLSSGLPDERKPLGVFFARPLSGQDLMDIWETGAALHPLDRGLTILCSGYPQVSWQTFAGLSIGQRDGLMLDLFVCTFGERLHSQAVCPSCRHELEFDLDARQLRVRDGQDSEESFQAVSENGQAYTCRLPNSWDLAALVAAQPADGARFLAQRCISLAGEPGPAVKLQPVVIPQTNLETLPAGDVEKMLQPPAIPDTVLQAFSAGIEIHDPQADLRLDLECPECGTAWQLGFDILDFFWTEIQTMAQRLARQVHLLARAYGWSERDILQMSPARRRLYLELLGS